MNDIKKAYDILLAVFKNKAYANLLIRNLDTKYNSNLIVTLVYGTLRNYKRSRYNWSQYVKGDLSVEISVLLDLGVFMLDEIKSIPDYAIVNEIVEISKDISYQKYTRLTNAVLKKHLKAKVKQFDENNLDDLAIKYSNPTYLVKMWNAHYGLEKLKKILKFNNSEGKLTLRVNTDKISLEKLLEDKDFSKAKLATNSVYYQKNIFESKYFKKGLISVQDSASQLVAEILDPKPFEKILDTCSAPGGKSIHMASLTNGQSFIDSVELYDFRAKLIVDEAKRLNYQNINVINNDARNLHLFLKEASYDKVLVDAPCSGFGVLRSKPEIKILTTPEDLDSLVKLQREIIDSAVKMVKVGGILVYSTCTINKKENEKQVEYLLDKYKNYQLESEEMIFGYKYDSDSFYVAKLKRVS